MDRRCHQLHHQVPYDGNQVPYSAATLLTAFLQKPGRVRLKTHTPSKKTFQVAPCCSKQRVDYCRRLALYLISAHEDMNNGTMKNITPKTSGGVFPLHFKVMLDYLNMCSH